MSCQLCDHKIITEEYPISEDEAKLCWIERCATHRDTWMIVANKHGPLNGGEDTRLRAIAEKYFPGARLRDEGTIMDHWHKHILEDSNDRLER